MQSSFSALYLSIEICHSLATQRHGSVLGQRSPKLSTSDSSILSSGELVEEIELREICSNPLPAHWLGVRQAHTEEYETISALLPPVTLKMRAP